jgi:hypothetical protein
MMPRNVEAGDIQIRCPVGELNTGYIEFGIYWIYSNSDIYSAADFDEMKIIKYSI